MQLESANLLQVPLHVEAQKLQSLAAIERA